MSQEDDFLIDDLLGTPRDGLETEHMPAGRALRRAARRRYENAAKGRAVAEQVGAMPSAGESIHLVSNGKYDCWSVVKAALQWLGKADELYCSTWTLCRPVVVELFALCDRGALDGRRVSFLSGLYFKRRETSLYAAMLEGLRQRGGRYIAFQSHAKVTLLCNPAAAIVIEGSANLNDNPRFEQYVITNDRALYDFHRAWMEEVLARGTELPHD